MAAVERVQSVDRVFALLELLADGGASLSLSELAERAALPMPTTHRLLRSLARQGYVRQEASKRYALGPRMIRLGEAASRNLGAWATPYLASLVEEFGETTNMATLEKDVCIYVAQVPSLQSVRMFTEVGRVVPVHSTGVGKALLSTVTDEQAVELLHRTGMPQVTPHTITTYAGMIAALAEIRERGYAVDNEEQELGVRCLAVPVQGLPFPAAVSVSGPSSRITLADTATMAPALERVASEMSAGFGVTAIPPAAAQLSTQPSPAFRPAS